VQQAGIAAEVKVHREEEAVTGEALLLNKNNITTKSPELKISTFC
jgi:hypothetical protein